MEISHTGLCPLLTHSPNALGLQQRQEGEEPEEYDREEGTEPLIQETYQRRGPPNQ